MSQLNNEYTLDEVKAFYAEMLEVALERGTVQVNFSQALLDATVKALALTSNPVKKLKIC